MSFDLKQFTDSILTQENVKEFLTDRAREELMEWAATKALPTARDAISQFNENLQECAKEETGWCKIRDGFFLPTVLSITVWFMQQCATYIEQQTSQETENKEA